MGCASSTLLLTGIEHRKQHGDGDFSHHVVSLTSTTYGVLQLLDETRECEFRQQKIEAAAAGSEEDFSDEVHQIVNLWEIMEGIEDELPIPVRSPNPRVFSRGKENRTPNSTKKVKKIGSSKKVISLEISPKPIPKKSNALNKENVKKQSPKLWPSINRKSDGVLLEKGIKKSVPNTAQLAKVGTHSDSLFEDENAAIIYTTTLRGIPATFEACNVARSIMESRRIKYVERDVSMDLGFREELRGLTAAAGGREVKLPSVLVKGRLIGGADEMVKLDKEGTLDILFDGIPEVEGEGGSGCGGCGGVRFVVCSACSGSCRVVVEEEGVTFVKCDECNENGIIKCPICCQEIQLVLYGQ